MKQAGGELLLVTMGTPEQAAEFRAGIKSELTFAADPQREVFRAYGLQQGTAKQVIGPKVWASLFKGLVRAGAGKPIGDIWQMPGAFVIDRGGVIRYAHYPSNQAEHPSHDEIVSVLQSLR